MCVVRLCLQYQGRGGPLQIGTGGHIRGAVGGRFGWGFLKGGHLRIRQASGNAAEPTTSDLREVVDVGRGESLLSLLSL